MRNQLKTLYSALLIVATLGVTTTVHGVPAFARQTGLDCNSCHNASGYPALNSFGQAFKAAGFTQGNDDEMIGDGEVLSIPKSMHMSLVFKGRVHATGELGAGDAEVATQVPDELAILAGGRIGKNIGWLTEIGGTSAEFASFKVVFAPEVGPVRIGIVPWFSDLTPAYFFETQSTGAVRNLRTWEDRGVSSAMNAISFGGANKVMHSGLGLYVWHTMGYLAFTPFLGGFNADGFSANEVNINNADESAVGYYTRLAVTPSFGNVEMGVGVQYYAGDAIVDDATGLVSRLSTLGVDAQAVIGLDMPIIATLAYASDMTNDASAFTVTAEIALVPDSFNAGLAYRLGLTDSVTSQVGLLLKYNIARNVRLQLDAHYDLDNNTLDLLPMVFGSF
jgi:hypothetical protein